MIRYKHFIHTTNIIAAVSCFLARKRAKKNSCTIGFKIRSSDHLIVINSSNRADSIQRRRLDSSVSEVVVKLSSAAPR